MPRGYEAPDCRFSGLGTHGGEFASHAVRIEVLDDGAAASVGESLGLVPIEQEPF